MRTIVALLVWGGAYALGLQLSLEMAGYLWTAVFLGNGAYCVLNFVRCREIHCLITAPGYFFFGVLALMKTWALVNLSWDFIWIGALVITGLAFLVQSSYECSTGSAYFKKA